MRRVVTNHERFMKIREMTVREVISVFRIKNLLTPSMLCKSCHENMVERERRTVDGFCWICTNINCISYRNTISVRKGSFFEEFRLPLADIFAIIILWAEGKQIKDIITDYALGKNTIVAVINKLRSILKAYYCDNHARLGGPGKICQIDESQFVHKIKHHRGRAPSSDVWVFGIADTSFTPAKCYMEIVPDRRARTLLPIIRRLCIPGTTIQSDGWAAYAGIEQELGFEHKVVNHKQNFVDAIAGVHTQNIESYWNKMKSFIK